MALNPHDLPLWNRNDADTGQLPGWAFAEEVAELSQEDRRHLGRAAGPAVWYAATGILLHTLLWLITPLVEFTLGECSQEAGEGIVQAPLDWLTLVGYVVLFAPPHLYCQWKCMKYVIVTQLEVSKEFHFLGFRVSHLKYRTWFAIYSALTCGATLNTLTNGQILGRTLATYACGAPYEELEVTWQAVMSTSLIHQLPGFHQSSFLRVSIFVYLLQLASPAFALAYALPRDLQFDRYETHEGTTVRYTTLYNKTPPTNHGSVVMVLASLARFEAVTFQDVTCATTHMGELEQRPTFVANRQLGADTPDWRTTCLEIARNQLDRSIARFAIIAGLQDALQTNLQASVVGMDWLLATTRARGDQGLLGGLDMQMFFSVALCFISTLSDLVDAVDVFKIVWDRHVPKTEAFTMDPGPRQLRKHVRRKYRRFTVYLLIFVGFSSWSLAKVVALFVCRGHIWNFHPEELLYDFSFRKGCVDALPSGF